MPTVKYSGNKHMALQDIFKLKCAFTSLQEPSDMK